MTVALLFVVCLLFAVGQAAKPLIPPQVIQKLRRMSPEQFRREVCPTLPKDGLFALRCEHESEKERLSQATAYLSKYGAPQINGAIILLPGLGGSALEAKIEKNNSKHWYCFKTSDWFRLWLPLPELAVQDCWFDNLQVLFDNSTGDYRNYPGVQIKTIDFGGLSGMDYLDKWFNWPISFTTYYSKLIGALEAVGFQAGKTLFGAPFDWRMPSSSRELGEIGFLDQFKALIESAYVSGGNKPVHIMSHSMGGPTSLSFFNRMNQQWLDKYIANFIPIAAPWAGAAKPVKTLISGDNFGIEVLGFNLINLQDVAKLARQAGGIVELLPAARYYGNDTFVQKDGRSYKIADFRRLFAELSTPITEVIYDDTKDLLNDFRPPRVPTTCVYGYGLPTEISYVYKNSWTDPEIITNDLGDGTVPEDSLRQCDLWRTVQTQPIVVKEFDLRGHQAILEDDEVFEYLIKITTK